MKKYNHEIVASVMLFLALYSISLSTPISTTWWEIYTLLYSLLITTWALFKKYSVEIFYYLSVIFFAILILFSFLDLRLMSNNVASIVFELLVLSLFFKFYNYLKKRS